MACVAAMHDLALLEINTPVSTTQTWTHPEYPGVILSFDDDKPAELTARWAMFLLHAGIQDMMKRGLYETSIFFGAYRGHSVGKVLFVPGPGHASPQTAQADPITDRQANSTGLSFDYSFGQSGLNPAVNNELHAKVEYVGKAMTMTNSLLMTIYFMMGLGSHHDEELKSWQCTFAAIGTEVRTVFNSLEVPRARRRYWLKSGDMVTMFARLAMELIREHRYHEMNLIISEAGTVIARGLIRTRSTGGLITYPLTANVSIA
ncbi:MAG: hypothetical protein Q9222_005611 [Ikaeria aurantiellina]